MLQQIAARGLRLRIPAADADESAINFLDEQEQERVIERLRSSNALGNSITQLLVTSIAAALGLFKLYNALQPYEFVPHERLLMLPKLHLRLFEALSAVCFLLNAAAACGRPSNRSFHLLLVWLPLGLSAISCCFAALWLAKDLESSSATSTWSIVDKFANEPSSFAVILAWLAAINVFMSTIVLYFLRTVRQSELDIQELEKFRYSFKRL
eukprot:TRINITY_DN9943_c0_g1_i1.p1 TRINITY_DN9943_c0_g1~~TRINITY_DN9943_c0_g1_i1.p1  ORF type:complete len:236 (-),score=19.59 TRINITY_DN9943_c0_g1_i1:101-733(-)